jgi:hypothetical protein
MPTLTLREPRGGLMTDHGASGKSEGVMALACLKELEAAIVEALRVAHEEKRCAVLDVWVAKR